MPHVHRRRRDLHVAAGPVNPGGGQSYGSPIAATVRRDGGRVARRLPGRATPASATKAGHVKDRLRLQAR